jgi:hypothetical protein
MLGLSLLPAAVTVAIGFASVSALTVIQITPRSGGVNSVQQSLLFTYLELEQAFLPVIAR